VRKDRSKLFSEAVFTVQDTRLNDEGTILRHGIAVYCSAVA